MSPVRKSKGVFGVDVIPSSGKRVLNDVVVTNRREITSQFFRESELAIRQPQRKSGVKWKFYFIVLAIFAALMALWAFYGRKMEVKITPKRFAVAMNKSLQLTSKTIEISDSHSDVFETKEVVSRDKFANGIVSIFNKSKDAQVLISSTRLEAPDGRIYRIPKTVVIPGARTASGKLLPGSKDVAVSADKSGAEHNAGLMDFTLPGLKSSSKYELVFGRSKTEMTGGAAGEQKIVGRGDADSALAKLLARARSGAEAVILKKLPQGEFFIPASLEYIVKKESANPPTGENADSFEFRIDGVARAAIVNKKALIMALIGDSPLVQDPLLADMADIKNLDKLSIKISGYKFGGPAFTLQVSGQAEVELTVDPQSIKETIINRNIEDATTLLGTFPELARAEITQKPFWLKPFLKTPSNPTRIDIIIE